MIVYAYRLICGEFKSDDWYLALSKKDIDDELLQMNDDPKSVWKAEIQPVKLLDKTVNDLRKTISVEQKNQIKF